MRRGKEGHRLKDSLAEFGGGGSTDGETAQRGSKNHFLPFEENSLATGFISRGRTYNVGISMTNDFGKIKADVGKKN